MRKQSGNICGPIVLMQCGKLKRRTIPLSRNQGVLCEAFTTRPNRGPKCARAEEKNTTDFVCKITHCCKRMVKIYPRERDRVGPWSWLLPNLHQHFTSAILKFANHSFPKSYRVAGWVDQLQVAARAWWCRTLKTVPNDSFASYYFQFTFVNLNSSNSLYATPESVVFTSTIGLRF